MDTINYISLFITLICLVLTIFSYSKILFQQNRLKEVNILTSDALYKMYRQIRLVEKNEVAFELDRLIRRIVLFTDNKELITQSLLWLYENGNPEDLLIIERAIKLRRISKTNKLLASSLKERLMKKV